MPKPFTITLGPFDQGSMNTYKHPRVLSPAEATTSTGVDYSDGTLRGYYGPGTPVAHASSSPVSFSFLDGQTGSGKPWVFSNSQNWWCLDGTTPAGTQGVAYYTDNNFPSVPNQLQIAVGPGMTFSLLGANIPNSLSVTNAGGSPRAYRVTHVVYNSDLNAAFESNPSVVAATNGSAGAVLTFPAAGSNAGSVHNYTYVYATVNGQTTGPFYYIGQAVDTATTFTDSPYAFTLPTIGAVTAVSGQYLLNWDAGGVPAGVLYKFDHSAPGPAPVGYPSLGPGISVLADALMGVPVAAVVGIPGLSTRSGILFGASYATLRWTMTGHPWYWPQANVEQLDDIIEAILVDRATAYAITRTSIYAISGSDDTQLDISKTAATHGCLVNGGRAATMTPYGILYPSRDGICLFDGTTSRVITEGILGPGSIPVNDLQSWGAYQDGVYMFGNTSSGVGYLFDLTEWPRVRVTSQGAGGYVAMARVKPYASTGFNRNVVYVLDANGDVRPWAPRFGGGGAVRTSWVHNTGALDAGIPTRKKKFMRLWLARENAGIDYIIACYNWDGSSAPGSGIFTTTASGWLPQSFIGDYLQISIQAGSDTLEGLTIEGEVYV